MHRKEDLSEAVMNTTMIRSYRLQITKIIRQESSLYFVHHLTNRQRSNPIYALLLEWSILSCKPGNIHPSKFLFSSWLGASSHQLWYWKDQITALLYLWAWHWRYSLALISSWKYTSFTSWCCNFAYFVMPPCFGLWMVAQLWKYPILSWGFC